MDHDREAQMLRAAQLYYYENLTQGAIADRMNCTRWTVGRLLDEARACGIVAISINHPRSRVPALEKRLVEVFGLGEAIVVRQQSTPAGTLELVAAAAADYITALRPTRSPSTRAGGAPSRRSPGPCPRTGRTGWTSTRPTGG